MSDQAYECPRCRTLYFQPLAECDWCPEIKPEPLADAFDEDKEGC